MIGKPNLSHGHVGSKRCPTPVGVADLFGALRARVAGASEAAEYHNWYTAYCVVLFAYGTGIRAVNDPLLGEADIDVDAGVAFISDKRVGEHDRPRLVPLVGVVIRQMQRYRDHMRVLAPQLGFGDEHRQGFFVLGGERSTKAVTISPGALLALLGPVALGAANAHRHYLRTELPTLGVPASYVNALMGHWQQGRNPADIHSSLDYSDYLSRTGNAISALLRRVNAVAVSSRYVGA